MSLLGAMVESTSFTRLMDAIERRPAWLRPVLYAPMILIWGVLFRGGLILVPLAVLALVTQGTAALPLIGAGALLFGIVFFGAAFSGLVHGLLGRHLVRLPVVGPALAGIVVLTPYTAAGTMAIQLGEHGSLVGPWDDALIVSAFCTVLFGVMIGYWWLKPPMAE